MSRWSFHYRWDECADLAEREWTTEGPVSVITTEENLALMNEVLSDRGPLMISAALAAFPKLFRVQDTESTKPTRSTDWTEDRSQVLATPDLVPFLLEGGLVQGNPYGIAIWPRQPHHVGIRTIVRRQNSCAQH